MSFILDALKKSENERQQRGSAEFSSVPMRGESARPPVWLWLLAALLLVNLVVLAGLLLRSPAERLVADPAPAAVVAAPTTVAVVPQTPPAVTRTEPVTESAAKATDTEPAPADVSTEAARVPATMPRSEKPRSAETQPPQASPAVERQAPVQRDPARNLPDIDQLRADGLLPLGELRLDIHVYSEVPADRFVFINMVKHREGSRTADGLAVDTITPDGVVLDYRGRRFLLPRQ